MNGLSTTLSLSKLWGITDWPEACLRTAHLEEYLSEVEKTWGTGKKL